MVARRLFLDDVQAGPCAIVALAWTGMKVSRCSGSREWIPGAMMPSRSMNPDRAPELPDGLLAENKIDHHPRINGNRIDLGISKGD